jgi:hypothetical protein
MEQVFTYNIMDLAWVSRLNVKLGIPDEFMLLTDEVLGPIFDRMLSMPMYHLSLDLHCIQYTVSLLYTVSLDLHCILQGGLCIC